MKRLEESGQADNTLIVFTTDQLTRGKWTCYQGVRVPVFIHWPGKVKPGVNHTVLSGMDLAPTILELIGGKPPEASEAILDGQSFAPMLSGAKIDERPLLVEMGYARAVIHQGWKYIATRLPVSSTPNKPVNLLNRPSGDKEQIPTHLDPSFGAKDELFDLKNDRWSKRTSPVIPHTAPSSPRCASC